MLRYLSYFAFISLELAVATQNIFAQSTPNNPCVSVWVPAPPPAPQPVKPSISTPIVTAPTPPNPPGVFYVGQPISVTATAGIGQSGSETDHDQNNCKPDRTTTLPAPTIGTTTWRVTGVTLDPVTGTTTGATSTATFTPAFAGIATISFITASSDGTVTSSQGQTTVTVVGKPKLSVMMTPATDQNVNPGASINFSATATGGTGTITYTWTFTHGSISSYTGSTPTPVTYSTTGTAKVTATDAVSNTDSKQININVNSTPPTVQITSPPQSPTKVVSLAEETNGVQLVAQATLGSSGAPVTFDWKDQNGGDWGPGTVSSDGLTSTLTYYPPGSAYGTQVAMSVGVTDTTNQSQGGPANVNLIVPEITPTTVSDLSYYDETTDVGSKTGGPETTLRIRIQPTPTPATVYSWTVAGTGSSITLSPQADKIHCDVNSCGRSTSILDQKVQLLGPDGSVVAEKKLTVHYPASSKPFGGQQYRHDDLYSYSGLIYWPGWETDYTMQLLDTLGHPMPDGTQNNESFDSWSGNITWYVGLPVPGSVSTGPLPICSGGNGTYEDDYLRPGARLHIPTGLHIGDAGCDDIAASVPQHYAAGSQTAGDGVNVNNHTLNIRRGHATQD